MDQLAKQYKSLALLFLGFAISAQFFILQIFPNYYSLLTSKAWSFILTNSFLYGCLVTLPLFAFENFFWKYTCPKVNLAGHWKYDVFYYKPDVRHLSKQGEHSLKQLLEQIQNNRGQMRVDQSPFEIRFQEGTGTLGSGNMSLKVTWRAISVSVTKEGKVSIHFRSNLGGIKFEGIDDLTVAQRSFFGFPTEMSGHFRMIPEGAEVVLRGEITYRRILDK